MFFTPLFKDARYFQIIFQCIFLLYGIFSLGWNADWALYATYLAVSIATQIIAEIILSRIKNKTYPTLTKIKNGIPSAVISSMGLCLLLKTNNLSVAALAALISITSKYIIRINGKHIFNPSALGIVMAVVFTGNAWISPGQWGSGAVILFAVLCLGFIITTRVQKLDTSLAFLLTFGGLLFIRQIIYLGWPIDFFVQSISTGSLLLFSFFMITDPKTTPNHATARIIWSMLVAAVAFYLVTFKFISTAPIWVLVCMQPLVPLLDKVFKAGQFSWKKINASDTEKIYSAVIVPKQ
ncbi:RnfABCDGE type electron transport complex subunit D [Ferruginibacter sp. SUN106]|uniref:RnfABCDGE type electron transport complex subunit D n=1 Tax=Ferruginibacter sp. SUN106 TaxID=2978348 RepID=UPI003D362257